MKTLKQYLVYSFTHSACLVVLSQWSKVHPAYLTVPFFEYPSFGSPLYLTTELLLTNWIRNMFGIWTPTVTLVTVFGMAVMPIPLLFGDCIVYHGCCVNLLRYIHCLFWILSKQIPTCKKINLGFFFKSNWCHH